MKISIILPLFFLSFLVNAEEVLLSCEGNVVVCGHYKATTKCDAPIYEKHTISIDGDNIKQVDTDGFLTFVNLCEKTALELNCSEQIQPGDVGGIFDEKGKRSIVLNRSTGKLNWKYDSTYGESHRLYAKGMRGRLNTYDAYCKASDTKTLF